jgi:hypothetical protein
VENLTWFEKREGGNKMVLIRVVGSLVGEHLGDAKLEG